MTQFRRRSWASPRTGRHEGMRLSTMIVLLLVVLLMIVAANQPEVWRHFLPNLDQPAPTGAPTDWAPATGKTAPTPPQAPQGPRPANRPSPLVLGGLIVLALAYFGWRIARIGRAVARRAESKRSVTPRPAPDAPQVEQEP